MINNDYILNWIETNRFNRDFNNIELVKILGIYYVHLHFKNKDDLYVTKYGFPFIDYLKPENFISDKEWYNENSIRLSGTSCTYKIKTKSINKKQIEIVIKWNRMGQNIPGEDESENFLTAEFNSPFEEFSLVNELRKTKYESAGRIITQKHLAIYVPSEIIELWQAGRIKCKMQKKIEMHKEVELDMFRSYVVIYEWVNGIDTAEAFHKEIISRKQMESLTKKVEEDLKKKGFFVHDRKPHHIIIRHKNKDLYTDREGEILYALVDFELLERTPERDKIVKKTKRINYLKRQKNRFSKKLTGSTPPNLIPVNILGVDYIYGHTESTNGALWVVGKDPELFDYFLPERWEKTRRIKLSTHNDIYYTITKDAINLVWKVSKVGIIPEVDPFKEEEREISEYGYNSPFEEISIAIYISRMGIRTISPRAIYMTGDKREIADSILDASRFESHKGILTAEGNPVLSKDRNYLLIWGYWNGPDEKLAVLDGDYYSGINALTAYRTKIISLDEYIKLIERKKEKLTKIGIEDLNLRGSHLLLSLDSKKNLVRDNNGFPDVRICNFEFLKRNIVPKRLMEKYL